MHWVLPRWGSGGDLKEVSSEPLWSSLRNWGLAVVLESESQFVLLCKDGDKALHFRNYRLISVICIHGKNYGRKFNTDGIEYLGRLYEFIKIYS